MAAQQIIIVLLRLIHIVAGVFWVGATLSLVRFIIPSIAATGAAGGAVMREIVRRRMSAALAASGGVTALAGLGLYGFDQAGSGGGWARTPFGITISIGALLGIAALIIGSVRARPAALKLAALEEKVAAAGGPPPADLVAEMGRLRDQLTSGTIHAAVLMVLATAAMAIARYV